MDRTLFKRDLVKELGAACKAEGLRMGCYDAIASPNETARSSCSKAAAAQSGTIGKVTQRTYDP